MATRSHPSALGPKAALIAVNRLRANGDPEEQVNGELAVLIDAFATQAGFRWATVGRCLEEPDVWILLTQWESVGTYRRALSSYAVKSSGYQIFVRIVDEPGAYEVLLSSD